MRRISVVGAVFVRNNKVLAAKRGEGKSLAGFWEFPGGKIEAEETAEVALRREIAEELLVEVEVGDFITTTDHEYDFGVVSLSTFYCRLLGEEPKLTEHAEIRWLDATELTSVTWAPADIPAIELIMKDAENGRLG